jgi:hypothetical protein
MGSHLLSRICWLTFGMSIGIYQINQGVDTQHVGVLISGIGMSLFGCAWFLRPVAIGIPLRLINQTSRQASLAPQSFYNALIFCAFGCLCFGLILRYMFSV